MVQVARGAGVGVGGTAKYEEHPTSKPKGKILYKRGDHKKGVLRS